MTDITLPFVEVNPQSVPEGEHDAVVIWLHGLGDSGNGFAPIVPELNLPSDHKIRFVFPHAPVIPITINNGMPMRAWYDIKTMDFNSRADVQGVIESAALVNELLEREIAHGIQPERIVLAGFSQGGVIAYHLGLRLDKKLAGILTLSTYMSQPELLGEQAHDANRDTPIFVGHGQQDEVVPITMGKAAFDVLAQNGYQATWKDYLMQHNVCAQELTDISNWLQNRLLD